MIMLRRVLAPALLLSGIAGVAIAGAEAERRFGMALLDRQWRTGLEMLTYLSLAWLLSSVADQVLVRLRPRNRPACLIQNPASG